MIILRILGTVWSAVFGLRVVLFFAIPWWRGTWFPYAPRAVRWHNGNLQIKAGRLIPEGLDRTGDGDIDDPEDFRTGAQTHWFITWVAPRAWPMRDDLVAHEERHISQEMLFGVFYAPLYGANYGIGRLRGKTAAQAYHDILFEVDARRAQQAFISATASEKE